MGWPHSILKTDAYCGSKIDRLRPAKKSKLGLAKTAAKRLFGQTAFFEYASAILSSDRLSHSQFGEDLQIRSFYNRLQHDRGIRVDTGLFVDVGAFRPVALSNSYFFYRQGWRCINIEPTPGMKRLFDRVRPRDVNLNVAISKIEGEATFYSFGPRSVWNTLDPTAADHAAMTTGIVPVKQSVKTRRLDSILQQHIGDLAFEVLSIDAEGFDIEILESNDFTRFAPRVLLIEANDFAPEKVVHNDIARYLKARNYSLFSWINPSLMFVRNDSLPFGSIPPAS